MIGRDQSHGKRSAGDRPGDYQGEPLGGMKGIQTTLYALKDFKALEVSLQRSV